MSLDIADFLYNSSKNIMFIEAPVGTGKSLGTLVPSVLYATKQQKSITYATSTINLQNQIFEADTVFLEKLGLLKNNEKILALGKTNYICKTVYIENRDKFTEVEKKQLSNYLNNCKYGLTSELEQMYPHFDKNKIKNYLLMSNLSDECFGNCTGHNHRYNYKSKRNKITITNHDQQIQTFLNVKNGRREIIPSNPGIIIFDEAHGLKENYLGRLEYTITYDILKNLKIRKRVSEYRKLVNQLNVIKKKYVKSKLESSMRYKVSDNDLEIIKAIKDIIESNLLDKMMSERFTAYHKNSDELENVLNQLEHFIDSDKNTSWLQFGKNIELHYVSNHFNKDFKDFITHISKTNKIIFMSGTLTSGKHVDEFKINWGLDEQQYIYRKYPTVFDFNKQTIIYVPRDLPHPSNYSENHLIEVMTRLPKILSLSSGGSLILCTSNEHVASISKELKKSPPNNNNVYTQGESSVSLISEKFKNDESSILVGSGSFFSGFSVEGRSLDKVVLTKLPYPVPTDPYIELISSGYDDTDVIKLFIKPMMFKKLEQGLGRLIRSRTDYGILTIFDSRIWNDPDIQSFFENHNYRITSELDSISKFMNDISRNGVQIELEEYKRSSLNIPSFTIEEDMKSFATVGNCNFNISPKTTFDHKNKSDFDLDKWLRGFVNEHKTKNGNPNHRISYKSLKDPKDYYQNAVNFCYKKGLPLSKVKDSFPYSSDRQRQNFDRIFPTVPSLVKIRNINNLN